MLSTEVFAPESPQLRRRLGAGSFASVYVVQEGPAAYKTVHDANDANQLLDEYIHLLHIHRTCRPDPFFVIPRPYGFCNPGTRSLLIEEPPYQQVSRRRPFLWLSAFDKLGFTAATYVMDRIFALPHGVGDPIREQFYNTDAQTASAPSLCRLYLGEVLDGPATRPSRFFNSANFPLDAARYTTLAGPLFLPPIEDVAAGMGEMLGHLHWQGTDGQDVEFVMGGDGFDGVRFFVIDFNQEISCLVQMSTWHKTIACIPALVSAFTTNDPYYPPARRVDPLYQAFRTGYVNAYPEESRVIGYTFLKAIEEEQALRDRTPEASSP